jgi:hypothetical protein
MLTKLQFVTFLQALSKLSHDKATFIIKGGGGLRLSGMFSSLFLSLSFDDVALFLSSQINELRVRSTRTFGPGRSLTILFFIFVVLKICDYIKKSQN